MKRESIIKRMRMPKEGRVWILKSIKKRIPLIALLSLLKAFSSLILILFVLVSKSIVNATLSRDADSLAISAFVFLVIIAIQILTAAVTSNLEHILVYEMDRDLKKTVFHSILCCDYSEVSAFHSGELLQRINSDVSNVIDSILAICTSAVSLTTGLIAAAVVLLRMAPQFTLFIIPLCVVLAFATIMSERDMKVVQKNVSRSAGKLSSFYQEAMENLLIVQSLDVTDEIEKKSDNLIQERIRHQIKLKDINVRMSVATSIFSRVGSYVTLIWGAYKVVNGVIDYGTLTAITSLVSQLQVPLLSLPHVIPKFILLSACTERILEVIGVNSQKECADFDVQDMYENIRCIRGENITFSYTAKDKKSVVYDGMNFEIPLKEMTVLTGSSGGGKSTLLKLLLGVYKPESGELYFEMKNGEKLPIDRSTRALFSYAPQGNLILSGTIRENILLANPNATEAEIQEALYISAMDSYIQTLPQGLDTMLGENGAGLSEGQVQRINIARAIVRKAPILLLDEVTSSLDIATEEAVLGRIDRMAGITCIAVTHRPAALALANWQLHVSDGQYEAIKRK